jgi:micrococcal nuclease
MIDLPPPAIICEAPRAVDGDTIRCANIGAAVRLLGIDAPELPGHCRRGRVCTPGDAVASQRALAQLLTTGPAIVVAQGFDRYARILAKVQIGTIDVSCRQIEAGVAVARYSPISC